MGPKIAKRGHSGKPEPSPRDVPAKLTKGGMDLLEAGAEDGRAPAEDDPGTTISDRLVGQAVRPDAAAEAGERLRLTDLRPDPNNRRQHNARNVRMVASSLEQVGAARSIVLDETNTVLAGNGVTEAAAQAGITNVRIIDADGDELIAVRRRNLSPEQKRALSLFDNRAAELSTWDEVLLMEDRAAGLDLQPFWTPEEEAILASKVAVETVGRMAAAPAGDEDDGHEDAPPLPGADYQNFTCALTTDQERIVRGALRLARAIYGVDTTGNALVAALQEWTQQRETHTDSFA
jgi:hypothetical protein